jgi:NitT/TauT family transport system ATP-binding protein
MEPITFVNTELPDLIELRNVRQTYDGNKKVVLDNLTLLVEDKPNAAQSVAILGESGCGKSTVLRYICGLQTPTSGEILIRGKHIDKKDRTGMVFQQYSSMPWLTVLQNVALGLKLQGVAKSEREDRAMEMIRIVGLEGHEKKYAIYPSLSGGQLQRVAIGRSLLTNPDMIVMDEPFGALDINTRSKMQDMMLQILEKYQPTVVFVTHDIAEAVYVADDVYIMKANPGQIVKHMPISSMLPGKKDRMIKRSKEFLDTVCMIEDFMINM